MFLRERLTHIVETVSETELAANRRLRESDALLRSGRYAGAIYLLGYVAEIHLKNAVYRRLGASPADQCSVFRRRAKRVADQLALAEHDAQWESGHGIRFWARLLWSTPSVRGGTLDADLRRSLCRHILRVERNWSVELRYSADPCSESEANIVRLSIEWIRDNRVSLWS